MLHTSKINNSLPLSYQRGALGRFSFCKTQVAKQAQVRLTYTNTAYLRQSGALALNTGFTLIGWGGVVIGVLSSGYQTFYPDPKTGKTQSGWLFAGDIAFSYIGMRAGPYGFAAGLGWTFVAKPVINSNFTIGIQPKNTSYGLWRTFP